MHVFVSLSPTVRLWTRSLSHGNISSPECMCRSSSCRGGAAVQLWSRQQTPTSVVSPLCTLPAQKSLVWPSELVKKKQHYSETNWKNKSLNSSCLAFWKTKCRAAGIALVCILHFTPTPSHVDTVQHSSLAASGCAATIWLRVTVWLREGSRWTCLSSSSPLWKACPRSVWPARTQQKQAGPSLTGVRKDKPSVCPRCPVSHSHSYIITGSWYWIQARRIVPWMIHS